ncbi:MAG: DUF2520 domain-containing protein [Dehalococcoidia bacterium]|nr:DUF2520 domain-containing protein [Dehalococcoidia bacterium]
MDDPIVGFIGAGAVGKGLALGLASSGYRVLAVSSRSLSSAEGLAARIPGCLALSDPQKVADRCDLIFITTPDEAIEQVASQVLWHRGQGVVHCSGAESLGILDPAAGAGAITGSFHPFQTFACLETPEEAVERMEGSTLSVEGRCWILDTLKEMASRLGGRAILLSPEDRAIYHASAVMSCGHLVALVKAAVDVWESMGVPQEEALPIILPLAKSTLANVSRAGAYASLTGPIARGDTATLSAHLQALEDRIPRLIPLYCALSGESLPLAEDRVSREKLEEMDRMFNDFMVRHVSETPG